MSRQKLASHPNFATFRQSDIDWMMNISDLTAYHTDTIIIAEGQEIIDRVEILLEGELSVCVSPTGQTTDVEQIDRVSPGELVEILSFVDNRPPTNTFIAVEPSQVLILPKHLLAKKLETDRSFAAIFYQMLSTLLSQKLRRLTNFLAKKQIVLGESLRKVLFVFSILNDRDIDWMISSGVTTKAIPETILIQEGKPVEAVYILLDGKLGIFVTDTHDQITQKEIAKSVKGEIIGEMSFVETTNASATVKVVESSLLLALPQLTLAQKLQQDPGFKSRFYQAIAVVLVDRIRDRLFLRGFAQSNYTSHQLLEEDIQVEDELDLDTLDNTAIASARFDWMIKRLNKQS